MKLDVFYVTGVIVAIYLMPWHQLTLVIFDWLMSIILMVFARSMKVSEAGWKTDEDKRVNGSVVIDIGAWGAPFNNG